jgi:hypothetical protein
MLAFFDLKIVVGTDHETLGFAAIRNPSSTQKWQFSAISDSNPRKRMSSMFLFSCGQFRPCKHEF